MVWSRSSASPTSPRASSSIGQRLRPGPTRSGCGSNGSARRRLPLRLDAPAPGFAAAFAALLAAKRETAADVGAVVPAILADVVARGDAALIDYTKRFHRLTPTAARLRIPP